jgi:inner membrane protein
MIGAMSGLTAVWFVDGGLVRWPWVVAAVLVGVVAALTPDLDGTDSTARTAVGLGKEQIKREWRKNKSISLIIRWIIAIPFNLFAKIVPHRGPTHWLVTAAVVVGGVAYLSQLLNLPPVVPVAFGAGYLSHLLADAVTVAGVPLLGPLSGRSVRFLPKPIALRTGGVAEHVFVSFLMAVYMAAGMWYLVGLG